MSTFKSLRHVLQCAAVLAAAVSAAWSAPAAAQGYPKQPIKVLVGYAAGGPTDLVTRLVTQDMASRMGQTAVVDNRAGASGIIGVDALLALPADGYTISVLATPTVVASIFAAKAVDPVKEFAPIGFFWDSGILLEINPAAPYMENVHTLKDLIAAAKSNPGKIYFTSAGTGSTGHLFGERLARAAGFQWSHIGYKGMGPASTDVMAGRVQLLVGSITNDEQLMKEGKVRALATTGPARDPRYPNVPSMTDVGYADLAVTTWAGLVARTGTPKEAMDRLVAELRNSMQKPEMQAKVQGIAGVARVGGPQEFGARVNKDYVDFARVIKDANIKIE